MAGIPKVKITFDADFEDLKKGIKGGQDEISSFGDRVSDFGKKAAVGFAVAATAAAVYATKLAVDGVKAAIEDEAAQIRLANSLENATGATNDQIKAVEDNILKMSLATGVSDDKLRPALSRLAFSTNDVTKAQDLLTLALDISQATGKDLSGVSNALAKAYDGNNTALGKLGVGLSTTELKSMSFQDVTTKLSDLFGGAAAANAETYQGKIARLKIGFDEAKESIGTALLPTIGKLIDYVNKEVVPAFGAFADGLNGKEGISEGFTNTQKVAYTFGTSVRNLGKSFEGLFSVFNDDANTGESSGLAKLIGWLDTIIKFLDKIVKLASFTFGVLGAIIDPKKWGMSGTELAGSLITPSNASSSGVGSGGGYLGSVFVAPRIATPTFNPSTGGGAAGGGGGSTMGGGLASAAAGASSVSMDIGVGGISGYAAAINRDSNLGTGNQGVAPTVNNITVNGAIDAEGTARQIVSLLNDSYYRGTGGASQFVLVS